MLVQCVSEYGLLLYVSDFFFFFQAEDGIRDLTVTGVQTCALPIYKNIVGPQHTDNAFAVNSYYELGLNLMDFRVRLPQISQILVRRVEKLAQEIYEGVFARERGSARFSRRELLALVKPLANVLRENSPVTFRSAESFIQYLNSGMRKDSELREFRNWWGRGQQYLSCLMR